MPRPLRVCRPDDIFFITNRCLESRFFFAPGGSDEVSLTCLQLLGSAQARYGVEIFGFVLMCNHFHLIARAPKLNLSEFMCHFQTQLAKFINGYRGRCGTVFPKRFDAVHVADDEALLAATLYLLENPTRAGLVEHPEGWPLAISHETYRGGRTGYGGVAVTKLPGFETLEGQQRELGALLRATCAQRVAAARREG